MVETAFFMDSIVFLIITLSFFSGLATTKREELEELSLEILINVLFFSILVEIIFSVYF